MHEVVVMNRVKLIQQCASVKFNLSYHKFVQYFLKFSIALFSIFSIQAVNANQNLEEDLGVIPISSKRIVIHKALSSELTPEETINKYGEYLAAQDVDKIIGLYHPNAEIIPDQSQSLIGIKAIIPFYHRTFNSIKIKGKLKITSVYKTNNIAIIRCEEPAEVTNLQTGKIDHQYFREMFVLVKSDNNWLIYKYMFSQNNSQAKSLI